jgi:hypothetical protein
MDRFNLPASLPRIVIKGNVFLSLPVEFQRKLDPLDFSKRMLGGEKKNSPHAGTQIDKRVIGIVPNRHATENVANHRRARG